MSLLPESRRRGPAVARGGAAAAAAIGCAAVPATSPGLGCLTPGPRPLLAQCYVMDPNTCNDEQEEKEAKEEEEEEKVTERKEEAGKTGCLRRHNQSILYIRISIYMPCI